MGVTAELIAGVVVFLLGLTFVDEGVSEAIGERTARALTVASKRRITSCLVGAFSAALCGNGTAVDVAAVSLTEAKKIPIHAASAIIIGANIGSTVVAQLVAADAFFDTALFSACFLLAGFAPYCFSRTGKSTRALGRAILGAGLLIRGVGVLSSSVAGLAESKWFCRLFLQKSPPILLLNGFFITAVLQSSSCCSAVVALLAENDAVGTLSAAYLLVGANVGSCVAVFFSSKNKSREAKAVAAFNFIFNLFCGLSFFLCLPFVGGFMENVEANARNVALFHTALNALPAIPALIFLKPLTALSVLFCADADDKKKEKRKGRKKRGKNLLLRDLNN